MRYADQVITTNQVKYIQILRRRLGVTDDLYNEMKMSVGAASTRDLTVRQFDDLIKRLIGSAKRQDQRQQAAARPAPEWKPVHSSARRSGMHVRPASDKEDMIRKIEAILTELRLPWSYADRMAKRMFGIDALRFCDPGQTYKLLQALCVYQKRKGGPAI